MPDEIQVTFDISCAFCRAFMPSMFAHDPETGEGQALFGECQARGYTHGCPAANMHGVQISDNVYRSTAHMVDEDGRAVVFTDERTPEEP